MSSNILLVEDDLLFAESLEDLLKEEGYAVTLAVNGEEALEHTFKTKFDLYLFDINLPLLNGMTLLKELRSAQDFTPTIFLTSHKDKERLKEGFSSGADDYITKPFDNEELLLRIEAILRRVTPDVPLQIGNFTLHEKNMQIQYRSQNLELSKKEYELLRLFLKNPNITIPKEHILQEIWQSAHSGSEGAIRVYINRLKHLLPDISIENIRGIGYRLVL